MKQRRKPTRVVCIQNLPSSVSIKAVKKYFSEAGPIERIFFISNEGTTACIHYKNPEDATVATVALNGTSFRGNEVIVTFGSKISLQNDPNKVPPKLEPPPTKQGSYKQRLVVVTNINYKAADTDIRKLFEKLGAIEKLNLVNDPDGNFRGTAFILFEDLSVSETAISTLNGSKFKGRKLKVQYPSEKKKPSHPVRPNIDDNDIKPEKVNSKLEIDNTEATGQNLGKRKLSATDKAGNEGQSKLNTKKVKMEDNNRKDIDDQKKFKYVEESKYTPTRINLPRGGDLNEGKTLFLQNVSLSATQEELRERFESFGELLYVVLCHHKDTGLFKGTSFVKFKEKMAADKCLIASRDPLRGNMFSINGQRLNISLAVERSEVINNKQQRWENLKGDKDKRNIYLAREGVIRMGTQAARGLSKQDLMLRQECEALKRHMLKNLNMFVSPIRLCVRNIPPNIDDRQLRKIFENFAPPEAVITECRVMMNLNLIDERGKPRSKGLAFIKFTMHQHALVALRQINNNPLIFTENKRPIVEFSIENRKALEAREKRLQRSRDNNMHMRKKGVNTGDMTKRNWNSKAEEDLEAKTSFMGVISDPKCKVLATHIGPKIRHRDQPNANKFISRSNVNHQIKNSRINYKKYRAARWKIQKETKRQFKPPKSKGN